jgi:hypothetical protein
MVLVWFPQERGQDPARRRVRRLPSYRLPVCRRRDQGLGAPAPDLHDALERVAEEGWSPVILDGQLFPTDRLVETTTSVKGEPIDTWYCGKHRDFGADIQAITRPDGLPL